MTKREICDERPTFAYYSGLGGLEARFIEYGIDDYLYLIAGQWSGRKIYPSSRSILFFCRRFGFNHSGGGLFIISRSIRKFLRSIDFLIHTREL